MPTKSEKAESLRLRQSAEALLRILLDSPEGVLAVGEQGNVLFANPAVGRLLGKNPEVMIGQTLRELLPVRETVLFEKCQQEAPGSPLERWQTFSLKRNRLTLTLETLLKREGGADPLTILYLRDMTERSRLEAPIPGPEATREPQASWWHERMRLEQQSRERTAFLDGLIDSSVDGIIAADMKGHIILFNRGAQQLLGYTEYEALSSLSATDLYPRGVAQEIMHRMRSNEYGGLGKCLKHRIIGKAKNGEEIPVSFSGSIIYDDQGHEVASFGIFTDLRPREEMENKLLQKQTELIQSEKMAALGRLAAGVAHEINNPLSGILIFANLVLEELAADCPQRADVERIINETTRCKTIVRELLDFARQDESCSEGTDINRIIKEGIHLLHNQNIFHNVKIVLDLLADLPPVAGPPTRLNQVILNLTLNAAEAMNGHGTLTVKSCLDPERRLVRVAVSDTGCGIPLEIQSKIFDPFFTTKEIGKGTGLGLSVSYRILQDCGGTIEVESAPGVGTTFTIELPILELEVAPMTAEAP